MTQPLALSPAMSDAVARWLEGEAGTRDRSAHTINAYRDDVIAFLSFLGGYHGQAATPKSLGGLKQSDMRAFSASERARGFSARSLARRLSAIRSFLRWISDREGYDLSAALSARGPKYQRSLPRPLAPDQARELLDHAGQHHRNVDRRRRRRADPSYGCGLRISRRLRFKAATGRWPRR